MKRKTLKNGLQIIHVPQDSKTIAVCATVKVGSNDEEKHEYGISHYIEHMLFEGTKKRDALQIASAIEGIGGEIGAFTSNERTCFYVKTLRKHFKKSLDVLYDILFNPLFSVKSLEKERNVILSEINMRKDEPRYRQWDMLLENLFSNLPIGHPVIGYPKTVKSINRELMVDYYKRFYSSNNIILSVVGGNNKVISEITRFFEKEEPNDIKKRKFNSMILNKRQRKKEKRDIKQTYTVYGFRTVPLTHKDAIILEVIEAILGRGMSGRLFDEIRNKRGLAYDLGAYHNPGPNYGFFAFYVAAEKEKIPLCKKIIFNELSKVGEVSEKELLESKNYLEGEFIMENEDNQKLAENLGLYESAGDLSLSKRYVKGVQSVTLRDIKRVYKKYFKNNYTEILIGK